MTDLSFTHKNCIKCGTQIFTRKYKKYCNDCLRLKFKEKKKDV